MLAPIKYWVCVWGAGTVRHMQKTHEAFSFVYKFYQHLLMYMLTYTWEELKKNPFMKSIGMTIPTCHSHTSIFFFLNTKLDSFVFKKK